MIASLNRRSFLEMGFAAGAAALAPRWVTAQAAPATDRAAQMRAAAANAAIKTTKLYDNLYLLQGAGGNMAVQTGADGKLLIDSSYSTAVPKLREALAALGNDPAHVLINTHWHIDHTDGNEGMHASGFSIYAHHMTRERLSKPSEIKLFNMSLPAAPSGALPVITFNDTMHLWHNGDSLDLVHFDPAHTDTDIYIHFHTADVLHAGDVWFNGTYPFIDESSGGSIGGMIGGEERLLALAGADTKIIPGHGPLGTKNQLQQTRDMLATVRDRVAALKKSGASEQEVVAKKPTADLDPTWGKGTFPPDMFVGIVYRTA
ncbi:MAG TPA: MBL fold metallo-hydrolase [Terracidiphilus sp.]|jgi:glyoxylase-like metal-dependent hydrolase (beta-lactamase superfamily II)